MRRATSFAKLGIVLAVLGVPALALALDFMTAGGFVYDVDEDGTGTMLGGSSDAYDTCYYFTVNGTDYSAGGTAPVVSADGRHIDMAPDVISGLTVERHVYVPATLGEYIRYVDVVTNPGTADANVSIEISGNLGSDSSTSITGTSSGDSLLTTADDWFATDDADGSGDPSLGHVVQGPGAAVRASTLTLSTDTITWTFSATVPAGGRIAFLTFAIQAPTRASSLAEAQRVVSFPDDALEGLVPYARDIVNFGLGGAPFVSVAGPSVVDEGAEVVIEADVFDLEGDTPSWSWDLDGDGTFGELPDATTYTIPAGTTDGETEVTVGIQATDGTATRTVTKTVLIQNVAPEITSEPPLTASGGEYRYQVEVAEPGGARDPLTFRLGGSPPPAMQITPEGLVTWTPPSGARGRTFSAIVRVLDDDLGQDIQTWDIAVGLNTPPDPPTPMAPLDFAQLSPGEPIVLVAENGSDPDGDRLTYSFQISPVSSFQNGVIGSGDLPEGEGMTSWTLTEPLAPGAWYWRVSVSDGSASSVYRFGTFILGEMEMPMPDGGTQPIEDAGVDAGSTVPPAGGGCSVSSASNHGGLALGLLAASFIIALRRRRRAAPRSRSSLHLLSVCCSIVAIGCTNGPPLISADAMVRLDANVAPPDAGSSCQNGMRDNDETQVDCGGSCDPCPDGASCVQPSDCQSGVCSRGFCLTRSCEDGVRNGPEVGVDCGGDCGLCGNGESCSSSAECLSGHCRSSMCVSAECDDGRRNGAESDTDCGGAACAKCGAGLSCATDNDCVTLRCVDATCAVASCSDRIQNQDETSVDCGGAVCAPCADGLACEFHLDCANRRCHLGGCVSCTDGVRNADEVDVDCGGSRCEPCRDGSMCVADGDCRSERCLGGLCLSCSDGVQNADETDIDCGGATCDGCAKGAMCGVDADCASNVCVDNVCAGYGDTCARPIVLTAGANTINWVATDLDYLSPPACSTQALDGPDLVMSYTATVNGILDYDITKPTSQRWSMVISTGACGTLTPEVQCLSEFTLGAMRGGFPVTAGTTYYFYLADTTSGTLPLSSPLQVSIDEVVPPCTPGSGGVVGTTLTRLTTGISSLTDAFVVPDENPAGYVYIGGTAQLYRVPKAGGPLQDIEALAPLAAADMGYAMVIAGNEIFTIDESTTSLTGRVIRISSDGGATWIPGGEDYATFGTNPTDKFRGAVAIGGTLYLITHETTTTAQTEIWAMPTGGVTLPVTPTLVGTISQLDCTGLAADASYFYTMCENDSAIVRIDRTTLATTNLSSAASLSTTLNSIAVDDTDADGVADAIYYSVATEAAYLSCGLDSASPFTGLLTSWGGATFNYGLGFDAANNVLYAYDDDTNELIIIQ